MPPVPRFWGPGKAAEGNIIAVNSGQTASYVYNALNQRVQTVVGGATTGFVFNAGGQRVSEWNWNGTAYAQLKGHYYWGGKPVGYYTTAASSAGAAMHFEHQDWLGTERLRTTYNGCVEGSYSSLPFGDGQAPPDNGTDANHYATLDHDTESGTDHAQFRQYSNQQGRFLSPDPYSGSYNASNPQSMNRYVYVQNSPMSAIDPSGMDESGGCGWGSCYPGPPEGGGGYQGNPGNGGGGGYDGGPGSTWGAPGSPFNPFDASISGPGLPWTNGFLPSPYYNWVTGTYLPFDANWPTDNTGDSDQCTTNGGDGTSGGADARTMLSPRSAAHALAGQSGGSNSCKAPNNKQLPNGTVGPGWPKASPWEKAQMILGCLAGMDPSYVGLTTTRDPAPTDPLNSTKGTSGQRGGTPIPDAMNQGSSIIQCIINVSKYPSTD